MAKKIVIVGAGIIGVAAAFRLQQAGASVTLVDAGGARATDASFGWINASFYLNDDHFHLRAAGLDAYARLARDLDVPVRTQGCLMYDLDAAGLAACHDTLAGHGYPVAQVDAARFAALEPAIASPPDAALLFPTEAAADPAALRQALLLAAQAQGAQLLAGVRVRGVDQTGAGISVQTTAGAVTADEVIIAAGTATEQICGAMDIPVPLLDRPAYVIESQPLPPLLNHILAADIGEVRQRPDGVLVLPAAVSHQADATTVQELSAADAADATIARVRRMIPDQPINWTTVTLAHRPVPADNLPVLGRAAAGVYVAVMHSGLTLAAIAAEMMAQEVLAGPSNMTEAMLATFRPQRFLDA